ncbi:hypothetical protein PV797_04450 [Clostridiaceae bacterium M8S5]|nr:hypothetical protein PV797_04450 [Clostridiaceae bacterium M8S5]
MENSVKAIIIGASIAITMVVVSVGFFILRQGQDVARNTSKKIAEINVQISESEYTMYEGTEISGSEVVNLLNKLKNEYMGINVITGKDKSGTWYIRNVEIPNKDKIAYIGEESSYRISDTIDETNHRYINPNGRFLGAVYRDNNGSIVALEFKQR